MSHVVTLEREMPKVVWGWRCSCGASRIGYMSVLLAEAAGDKHLAEEERKA